jgi:hypothetical protein
MEEHQNRNLTGSRQKFGKMLRNMREKKFKIWDDEIKFIVQQKNVAYKKYI